MTIKTSPYSHDDYKAFLRALVKISPKGFITRLAEAAGCKRSYMSDVLRGNAHLTPDHAFGIAQLLAMPADESDFFMDLVQYARASSKSYRNLLRLKLQARQKEHARLSARIKPPGGQTGVAGQGLGRYYSSWHRAALHIASAVEKYDNAAALARRFGLTESQVLEVMHELIEDGFVIRNNGRFQFHKGAPHLEDRSPFTRMNHLNWRTLSTMRLNQPHEEVHYSSVFAVAEADFPKIREELLGFISYHRDAVAHSGSDDVFVFACDLFRL